MQKPLSHGECKRMMDAPKPANRPFKRYALICQGSEWHHPWILDTHIRNNIGTSWFVFSHLRSSSPNFKPFLFQDGFSSTTNQWIRKEIHAFPPRFGRSPGLRWSYEERHTQYHSTYGQTAGFPQGELEELERIGSNWDNYSVIHVWAEDTLLGTNMSHQKTTLKMMFLFQWWDMLVSWRVVGFRFNIHSKSAMKKISSLHKNHSQFFLFTISLHHLSYVAITKQLFVKHLWKSKGSEVQWIPMI